jgi:predicted RNA-binding Zn-ribbon protein involved in translation (DUF1610 family)
MPLEVTCNGWAPGLNIPDGECVHCHIQKREHPKALQSRASGSVNGISAKEFSLADSPLASHPEMISPASSAAKVRPEVVFCRNCNQGLVLKGIESGSQAEADYACPKCGSSGPKSKTPSGEAHGAGHAYKPVAQKTPTQIAFEDGVSGVAPRRPDDKAYMEWHAEGAKRRAEDVNVANSAKEVILEGETEDVPLAAAPDAPVAPEGDPA